MNAMDSAAACTAWLHLGSDDGSMVLDRQGRVSPLWCLLLARAAVVPAITAPEVGVETPRQGLRVALDRALDHWQQFCAFIAEHPQFHRVPALGVHLAAVVEFIEQVAQQFDRPLAELWLQGDLDALSGPFDQNVPSRIEFWRWNADSRLDLVQAGDPLELHEITLVVDFEDLQDWCRGFGLDSFDHPYFHELGHACEFVAQATAFSDFREAQAEPLDPWQQHNFRAHEHDGLVGMLAEDGSWHVSPQWQEICPDAYSYVRVWVRQGDLWGLLQIEPQAELLFAPQFDAVVDSAADDFCVASLNGRQGLLDIEARDWRMPPVHEELRRECNGLLRVREGALLGYLDDRGGVLQPPRYQQTRPFGSARLFDAPGVAWVVEQDRWGLIDSACRPLQPCVFERVEFREEHDQRGWRVWQAGRQGWVNAAGVLVVACEWDEVDCYEPYQHACAAEGIYRVVRDGRQGLLPSQGDWRIACDYDDIEPLGVGPGAAALPEDELRHGAEPEESDLASYVADGDAQQSRLLIRVHTAQGCAVIDEAGRQIVPPGPWQIEPIGNGNLHWLRLQDEQERYQLWDVARRTPALPGWHAGVDVLHVCGRPVLLSFAEEEGIADRFNLQLWNADGQPAFAERCIGLLGETELHYAHLWSSQREELQAAWGRGEAVEALAATGAGPARVVSIVPGRPLVEAEPEWQRRYCQGDLDAALALSRHSHEAEQAYQWARNACGLGEVAGRSSAAAWLHLVELAVQGSADLPQARSWAEQGLAADPQLEETGRLLLCVGRLWLDPAAGEPDVQRAFEALERVQLYSGHHQSEHAESLYLLGQCWQQGLGCTADTTRARELWRSASADGPAAATEALVRLLAAEAEQLGEADAAAALWEEALHHAQQFLEYHGEAAPRAPVAALQAFVGELLLSSEPVEWELAEEYLLQAAEAGNEQAMGLLAEGAYRDKTSPLRSLKKALHWAWRHAAAQRVIPSAEVGWQRWLFAVIWLLRR